MEYDQSEKNKEIQELSLEHAHAFLPSPVCIFTYLS